MTNPAIVAIFTEMNIMAEHYRFGVVEAEEYILGFLGVRHDGQKEGGKNCKHDETQLHGILLNSVNSE